MNYVGEFARRRISLVMTAGLLGACSSACYFLVRPRVIPDAPVRFSVERSFLHLTQPLVYRVVVSRHKGYSQRVPSQTMWVIEAVDRPRPVKDLPYGVVPEGFVQRLPAGDQRAPALEPGWVYAVAVSTSGGGSTLFTYEGREISQSELEQIQRAFDEGHVDPGLYRDGW